MYIIYVTLNKGENMKKINKELSKARKYFYSKGLNRKMVNMIILHCKVCHSMGVELGFNKGLKY